VRKLPEVVPPTPWPRLASVSWLNSLSRRKKKELWEFGQNPSSMYHAAYTAACPHTHSRLTGLVPKHDIESVHLAKPLNLVFFLHPFSLGTYDKVPGQPPCSSRLYRMFRGEHRANYRTLLRLYRPRSRTSEPPSRKSPSAPCEGGFILFYFAHSLIWPHLVSAAVEWNEIMQVSVELILVHTLPACIRSADRKLRDLLGELLRSDRSTLPSCGQPHGTSRSNKHEDAGKFTITILRPRQFR